MTSTHFTADLHLGHGRILEYEPEARPFGSLEEMHQAMEERWNKRVSPGDTVIIVGDVAFGLEGLALLARFNGTKRLVRGNHDEEYSNKVFGQYFTSVNCYRKFAGCLVSHVPVHPCQLQSRFVANIHGHLHSLRVRHDDGSIDPRYLNVSVEQWGLAPVAWEDLQPQVDILRALREEAKAKAKAAASAETS